MTPREEHDRLFGIVWQVAMNAAAAPIQTGETRIPKEIAEEARALLAELGYDWEAGRAEHLAEVDVVRQGNVDRMRSHAKKVVARAMNIDQ